MKVHALLSFFDEDAEALYANVKSYAAIADHVIAVDGRYAHFPSPLDQSPDEQHDAIRNACAETGMELTSFRPVAPWAGGEVAKRAAMFRLALASAEPMVDWFIVLDADVSVGAVTDGWRDVLESTGADTANVRVRNIRPDGKVMSQPDHRAMFRAVPGLTVVGTHWCYCIVRRNATPRYMWMTPAARMSDEPCADLTGHVTIEHRNLDRGPDRAWASRMYYRKRDELCLERAPRW